MVKDISFFGYFRMTELVSIVMAFIYQIVSDLQTRESRASISCSGNASMSQSRYGFHIVLYSGKIQKYIKSNHIISITTRINSLNPCPVLWPHGPFCGSLGIYTQQKLKRIKTKDQITSTTDVWSTHTNGEGYIFFRILLP